MINALKTEVATYGNNLFLQYDLYGDMGDFITKIIISTSSRTLDFGIKSGKEKPYTVTPISTWKMDANWGIEEKCEILKFIAYDGGELHPLLDILMDGANIDGRKASIRITNNPVDKGERRLAYRAVVTESAGYTYSRSTESKKWIAKESIFEGKHNSRDNLIAQANIQAVAIYLAKEFNLAVQKLGIAFKKIFYVTVELVHIPTRRTGKNYWSLEPYIEGEYIKFNNNSGYVDKTQEIRHPILQAFSHFSFCYSRGILMITDIQGAVLSDKYLLTDPAIHTAAREKQLPDPTNLGTEGMAAFFATHICNDFCRRLRLQLPADLDVTCPLRTVESIAEVDEEEEQDD